MLELKFVQNHLDVVRKALADRHNDLNVNEFAALDEQRKALIAESEALKAERNQAGPEIAKLKRSGGDASALLQRMQDVAARVKVLDEALAEIGAREQEWLLHCPNIPHEGAPVGKDEHDNPVVRIVGEKPQFDFAPKEHHEIGTALGGLDFERAAKLAGARFAVSYGWAARLERAISAFMLDLHTREHGYLEILPPYIVNSASMTGTGQLPKFKEDLFHLEGWDYWLIPTAEVPVTNLLRDETIQDEDRLPLAFCAFTPCFRSEAGSYGKDTKGLIRQHQFHKVELVRFSKPEESFEQLELLTRHAEEVLQRLGLPYRVIELCTGDLGFSSCKTYDLEVWLPGQNAYREISSCSNFVDFQARRAGIRYRPKGSKKSAFVHTLNGSGLAVGRTLVAVLENYQRADGGLTIPEVLRPYMGGVTSIEPGATGGLDRWL